MRWWTIGCLVLLVAGALPVAGKEFSFQVKRDLPVNGPAKVSLQYHSGQLRILTSPEPVIKIDATKRVDAVSKEEAEEIAGHIELQFNQKKNNLQVATNYMRIVSKGEHFWEKMLGTAGQSSYGDVDWVITIPEGSSFEIVNVSGGISASDLKSDLTVTTSGSPIELARIEGDVTIRNENGSTSLDLVIGNCTVMQPGGSIDLHAIEGDVRIKSVSAAIEVQQERGAIDITTMTGRVDVQTALEATRACLINSESGNVHLEIPRWSSGTLAIESQTGTVKTTVPITISSMTRQRVVGQFGDGGVSVTISSTTGDVTVAQY